MIHIIYAIVLIAEAIQNVLVRVFIPEHADRYD